MVSFRTSIICFLTAGVSFPSPAVCSTGTFPSVALWLSNPVLTRLLFRLSVPCAPLYCCDFKSFLLSWLANIKLSLFLCLMARMIDCSDLNSRYFLHNNTLQKTCSSCGLQLQLNWQKFLLLHTYNQYRKDFKSDARINLFLAC